MQVIFDTTRAMYLQITGDGGDQLHIVTVIDGLRNDDIRDASCDRMDFCDKSGLVVGKLRFKSDEING